MNTQQCFSSLIKTTVRSIICCYSNNYILICSHLFALYYGTKVLSLFRRIIVTHIFKISTEEPISITLVGSTSPWIIFRIDIYFAWLASFVQAYEETIIFLVWKTDKCQKQTGCALTEQTKRKSLLPTEVFS